MPLFHCITQAVIPSWVGYVCGSAIVKRGLVLTPRTQFSALPRPWLALKHTPFILQVPAECVYPSLGSSYHTTCSLRKLA